LRRAAYPGVTGFVRRRRWAVGSIVDGHIDPQFSISFQIWIILQGREFYEKVLKDPNAIIERISADDPATDFRFLYLQTAARNTYEDSTGKELPDIDEKFSNRQPAGKAWSWRDLQKMHPQLWEKFFLKRHRRPRRPEMDKMKDDELVWAAADPLRCWVDIYSGPEYLDEQYKTLSEAQRGLHAVSWFKSECDNGGIDQFFYNSTGVVAPEVLKGLKMFGAKEHSEVLETIMKAFPGGSPERDRKKRQAQMEKRWRSKEKAIDDEFPGGKMPDLEEIIGRYIRVHPEQFFRPK